MTTNPDKLVKNLELCERVVNQILGDLKQEA